jgi:hypothetical protein
MPSPGSQEPQLPLRDRTTPICGALKKARPGGGPFSFRHHGGDGLENSGKGCGGLVRLPGNGRVAVSFLNR